VYLASSSQFLSSFLPAYKYGLCVMVVDGKDVKSLLQESGGGVPSYRCLVAKPLVLPVDTPYLKDTG